MSGLPAVPKVSRGKAPNLSYAITALVIVIIFARKALVGIMAYFYNFLDRLLALPGIASPVARWIVLGLLTGLIYAGYASVIKYNLNKKIFRLPLLFFCVLIATLALTNRPWLPENREVDKPSRTIKIDAVDYVTVTFGTRINGNFTPTEILDRQPATALTISTKTLLTDRLHFRFDKDSLFKSRNHVQCTGLFILNGDVSSVKAWKTHCRVKEMAVYLNSSLLSYIHLRDNPDLGWEFAPISPHQVNANDTISLQVISVYSSRFKSKLTAISELTPVLQAGDTL